MIVPSTWLLRLAGIIFSRLGLYLDLQSQGIVESLDEAEVAEQLRYGRD